MSHELMIAGTSVLTSFWSGATVFAFVAIAIGCLSARRRAKWSGTCRRKAELYRYVGGSCLTAALIPVGLVASNFIDFEVLWDELASITVVAALAGWGTSIVKTNKFDINDLSKSINLVIFGLFAGLSLPGVWRMIAKIDVLGGPG